MGPAEVTTVASEDEVPRYECASPEWVAIVRSVIEEVVETSAKEGGLAGIEYSMCEVYTGVPPGVAPKSRVGWHFRIANSLVHFEPVEADDVDTKVIAAWDVIAPMARVVLPEDGVHPPEVQKALAEASASGRLEMVSRAGRKPPAAISDVHNRVARQTL